MGRTSESCDCTAAARQLARDGLDALADQLRAAHRRGHHVQFATGGELDLVECLAAAAANDDAHRLELRGRLRALERGR